MKVAFFLVCSLALASQLSACGSKTAGTTTPVAEDDVDEGTTDDAFVHDTKTTDAKTADLPPPNLKTCAGVSDCVAAACATQTPDCEKACLGKASPSILPKAQAVFTCARDKCRSAVCKDATDPACVATCTGNLCMDEVAACVDAGVYGADSCGDLEKCIEGCGAASDGYFTCMAECYASRSQDAAARFDAAVACSKRAASSGQPEEQACKTEFEACIGPTARTPPGTSTCYQGLGCASKCQGPDAQTCATKCVADMTAAAQTTFGSLQPCLGKADMMTNAACIKALLACVAPSGKATCSQTMACQNNCEQGTDGCVESCLHDASAASAAAWFKILPCVGGTPAGTPPSVATCSDALVACAAPSGTDTCVQVVACMQACPAGAMNCRIACIGKGSAATGATISTLLSCQSTCESQCKNDSDPMCPGKCMGSACPAETSACISL